MADQSTRDQIYQLLILKDRASLKATLDEFAPDDACPLLNTPIYLQINTKKIRGTFVMSKIDLMIPELSKIYSIDLLQLGFDAFMTKSSQGISLQAIIELAAIPKVFFDARRPARGIYLDNIQNIQEVQILELATRPNDLDKEQLADLDSLIKEHEITIPKWECGRCTGMVGFDERLLALPALRRVYMDRLSSLGSKREFWQDMVFQATVRRAYDGICGDTKSPWSRAFIEERLRREEQIMSFVDVAFPGPLIPSWRKRGW